MILPIGNREVLDETTQTWRRLLFERIVARAESALCVYAAPACGWSDLGTPRGVGRALYRPWISQRRKPLLGADHAPAFVNLAARYGRLEARPSDPGAELS